MPIVLSFDDVDLNNARNGTSNDEWQQILAGIPDDATVLDFSVNANFNAAAEDMFFDQLTITGTQVPEPASLAVWTLLGLSASASPSGGANRRVGQAGGIMLERRSKNKRR